MSISENVAAVRERIASAARRAGRNADGITLMAVTKTQPPERIREAHEAGLRIFGENRVQEFAGNGVLLGTGMDSYRERYTLGGFMNGYHKKALTQRTQRFTE